jgi:hypothetical protein
MALCGLATATSAAAQAKEKLLVAKLAVEQGVSESTGRLLGELLSTELGKSGRFEVVAEADIQAMLKLENDRQLLGCSDVTCIAEMGGAMGAERVLTGSVGQVGELFVLNLKIVNTRLASVEARWSDSVGRDQSALIAATRTAVADMLRQTGGEPPAVVAGSGGAETPPLGPTTPPAVSETAAPPVYQRWWFWTGVGAVVVGGVVLTYLLLRDTSPERGTVGLSVTLPEP